MMFLTFWSSCSVTDSRPASCPHRGVAPRLWLVAGCFGKCKSSIPSGFSQGDRADGGSAARSDGPMAINREEMQRSEVTLDAPAVTLGVLKGTLHLFPQNFGEDGAAHSARAWLGDVRRPVTTRQHPLKRLLDPVRFQRKAEGVSQHHRGAKN